jgi:Na+-translocating ferredoxin:NAD+ oxidoreductase RnfD subunit
MSMRSTLVSRAAWSGADRLGGLRRFAIAITILNLLGHLFFGFEQAWITPFVALAAAYGTEAIMEAASARAQQRRPRWRGQMIDFVLPAHITGLAVGMLLYTNGRLGPVVFAAIVAIVSKFLLRCTSNGVSRHVMNPSNFGIAVTLILFPSVGIAPPYHFTENLGVRGDWILPAVIVASGSFLNLRFTRRVPLLSAWVVGYVLQAAIRSLWSDAPLPPALTAPLAPMTGMAFVLYTFYMVTDPATTPQRVRHQVLFGLAVALTYGALVTVHVVFGFFFALSLVSAVRAAGLYALSLRRSSPADEGSRPAIALERV